MDQNSVRPQRNREYVQNVHYPLVPATGALQAHLLILINLWEAEKLQHNKADTHGRNESDRSQYRQYWQYWQRAGQYLANIMSETCQ